MPNKMVQDALDRANAAELTRIQNEMEQARQVIDGATMRNVDEITTPPPKVGAPDPTGAAMTRLNPDFESKIEAIQKGDGNYPAFTPVPEPIEPTFTEPIIIEEIIIP